MSERIVADSQVDDEFGSLAPIVLDEEPELAHFGMVAVIPKLELETVGDVCQKVCFVGVLNSRIFRVHPAGATALKDASELKRMSSPMDGKLLFDAPSRPEHTIELGAAPVAES
jgi:hypothetical protein